MAIFTIGDLHLSLGTSKPMDIFSGWENYVERLRENWPAAVGPQDTVVLGGGHLLGDEAGGLQCGFCVPSESSGQETALEGKPRLLVDDHGENERLSRLRMGLAACLFCITIVFLQKGLHCAARGAGCSTRASLTMKR